MQKEFYYNDKPQNEIWDGEWTIKAVEQELEACDIEAPPRELFFKFLSKQDKILDAGCGIGKWVVYLHRRGYNIWGIDNNELAISKLKQFDKTFQVELGDILNIHYPDNYFDACISMGVIEHFEEGPLTALNEAYRILKPGGLIFVSVPTVNVFRRLIKPHIRNAIIAFVRFFVKNPPFLHPRQIKGRRGKYYHFDEYRYSKSELENFLKKTGFEIIKTIPHDHYDSKDHAIGLVADYPFLGDRNGVNFKLNSVGKCISRTLDSISPWIACASVICVARSLKKAVSK